jgi:hypothetical protein
VVYLVLAEDVPDAYREHPAVWRERLDAIFEPKLSPEEEAEIAAEQAEANRRRLEREWEAWGTSEAQQKAQERFMAMAGPEG